MPSSTKTGEIGLSAGLAQSASKSPRILAADDQQHILEAIELLLKPQGYEVDVVRSPELAREALATSSYDAILIDLNYTRDTTSGQEGLGLLSDIVAMDSTLPVIVMTAWGNVDLAVEAMRRGARDFIQKPWENDRLLAILRTQVELHRALQRAERLAAENRLLSVEGRPEFIATAPSMVPVLEAITRFAPSDANVLITGEHGTGKELVARWLHAASARAGRSFIAVNMGGLSPGLFESELFGHVKGAFTDARSDRVGRFELADGGTLFLDEIATLQPALQAKLLRVLQSREIERVGSARPRAVDVRVLSATNVDLRAEVDAGRFREDLLFRLNTIEITLPPLRERREDIAPLATYFLRRHAARYHVPLTGLDSAAMQVLLDHSWPGNIRELDHAVERAVLLAQGDMVRAGDFALRSSASSSPSRLDELTLEDAERLLIQKALSRYDGNVTLAARALGLSRSALYRRLASHGL